MTPQAGTFADAEHAPFTVGFDQSILRHGAAEPANREGAAA
jgi:hypothetical protein